MSDFDDLRNLSDDDDDSAFSFDDIVDDGDEFGYGQEIGAEGQAVATAHSEPGPINKLLNRLTAQQRMVLAVMAFVYALILAFGLLLVTGRI